MVKALVFGTKDLCVRIAPWSHALLFFFFFFFFNFFLFFFFFFFFFFLFFVLYFCIHDGEEM